MSRRGCRRRIRSGSGRGCRTSASRSSAAWMLSVGSSRIAVCGQAPVSTASTRAGSISPLRRHAFRVLLGRQIVGNDREVGAAPDEARDQLLEQACLARADRAADADARGAGPRVASEWGLKPGSTVFILLSFTCAARDEGRGTRGEGVKEFLQCLLVLVTCHSSLVTRHSSLVTRHGSAEHIPLSERHHLRRLAGDHLAVDHHVEGLRIHRDVRAGVVVQHVRPC